MFFARSTPHLRCGVFPLLKILPSQNCARIMPGAQRLVLKKRLQKSDRKTGLNSAARNRAL